MAIDLTFGYQEGIQALGPGANAFGSLGSFGNLLTSDIYGEFGELTRRGLTFSATVAAAAAVPVNTTLTNAPCLWNPAGSGKICIPLRVSLSLGAIGTPILNGFTISYLTNTGDNIGTAAPVVTFTAISPVSNLLGRGITPRTRFAGAVVTYTTQPAKLMDLGFGHIVEGTAASGQLYSQFHHDFKGSVIMPPGTLIALGSTIATSTTYWSTFVFAELTAPSVL